MGIFKKKIQDVSDENILFSVDRILEGRQKRLRLKAQYDAFMRRVGAWSLLGLSFASASLYHDIVSESSLPDVTLSLGTLLPEIMGADAPAVNDAQAFNLLWQLHRTQPEKMAEYYNKQAWHVGRDCAQQVVALCPPERRAVVQALYDSYVPSEGYEQWQDSIHDALLDALLAHDGVIEARAQWRNMLPDARLAVLHDIAGVHADVLAKSGLPLWDAHIEVDDFPGGTLASYSGYWTAISNWGVIKIDRRVLAYSSFDTMLGIMLHELAHLRQDNLADAAKKFWKQGYLHDNGIYSDVVIMSHTGRRLWLSGQTCQDGEYRGNAGYFNRPIERDARQAETVSMQFAMLAAMQHPVPVVDNVGEHYTAVVPKVMPFAGSLRVTLDEFTPKADDMRVMTALPPKPKAMC